MSTRATYSIDGHHFYIHHDGYPAGAADYFRAAIRYPKEASERAPTATFADDFMRANARAELIHDPEEHADTEFHYTVSTLGDYRFGPVSLSVSVYKRGWSGRWTLMGLYPLEDFIETALREVV